ncbi:MAG: phosphoribosyl-ATP diphosphatase [Proteobacteria bacterium]|nr:phosphoribosyl-ATP diphosphatase [Pseudomonadota bacterium]MBI3498352.1 phosphoribosyl-ATP diphosphatase [Pseudomonadota bacterium]
MARFSANATAKDLPRTRTPLAAVEAVPALNSAGARTAVEAELLAHPLARLHLAIEACRGADPNASRTARLIGSGRTKMAKKLCEEAAEVAIAAVKSKREGVIAESADLLYHLAVLWSAIGIKPGDVWAEMDRREALLGIAEKRPKSVIRIQKPEAAKE